MKKIVTLFVAIAAFCGFTSKAEEATTFEVNRIKYTVTGENSVGVSGLNENYEPGEVKLTEVIIPSTVENAGKNYTVTSVEEYRRSDRNSSKLFCQRRRIDKHYFRQRFYIYRQRRFLQSRHGRNNDSGKL